MNAKYRVLWISLFVIALFAGLSVTQAQTGAKADVVTAISNLIVSKPPALLGDSQSLTFTGVVNF
jgi:hypothetical protein